MIKSSINNNSLQKEQKSAKNKSAKSNLSSRMDDTLVKSPQMSCKLMKEFKNESVEALSQNYMRHSLQNFSNNKRDKQSLYAGVRNLDFMSPSGTKRSSGIRDSTTPNKYIPDSHYGKDHQENQSATYHTHSSYKPQTRNKRSKQISPVSYNGL